MNFHKKKLILSILLVLGIALAFWLGSRYPQLNSKALMGVDSPSMGISFDMVKEVKEDDSDFTKVISNTINWIDTNKKGMTFGFLFGAGFILLFSLLKDVKIKNRFVNTALGAIIGAPLGVCVNCAAPIAKGMKDAGARTETALATMITSPTMNVIVLSMLFSFLPSYMVWLKIGFTLVFIFLMIPLLAYLVNDKNTALAAPKPTKVPVFNLEENDTDKLLPSTWLKAILWTTKSYFKSLFFIVKTTLPLMLLAGLLGNIIITYLPLEDLIDLVKNLSLVEKMTYMAFIALFATFLPVPIAFDVIITAILWSTGLHTRYAMVLLFCLGTFSIYSSFIVAKSFSFKLAIYLFLVTAILGFSAGVSGHFLEKKLGRDYLLKNYEAFKKSGLGLGYHLVDNEKEGVSVGVINEAVTKSFENDLIYSSDSIRIVKQLFNKKNISATETFKSIEGNKIGLNVPYYFSVKEVNEPFANQRSIASGDVHNDGYSDLLLSSAGSVFLYANLSGNEFLRQKLQTDSSLQILNAALVDLDNDGWLDVFISSYRKGNYILKNEEGDFSRSSLIKLPQLEHTILSHAAAFNDINKDGLLDIFLGNWSIGSLGAFEYSMKQSENYYLLNEGDFNFNLKSIEGIDGESLTVLLADFTDDGETDLIVGNDFNAPDQYYIGLKNSNDFQYIKNPEKRFEKSPVTTMSVTSVDINNDLVSEIYQVNIGHSNTENKTNDIELICDGIVNEQERKECETIFKKQRTVLAVSQNRNFEICPEEYRHECVAIELIKNFKNSGIVNDAEPYFSESWKDFAFISRQSKLNSILAPKPKGPYHERIEGGILLKKNDAGFYESIGDSYNLSRTGWAWNSKFADVDNDEWQDVLVANGFLFVGHQETNIFYKNNGGQGFEDKTEEMNLTNYLPASSYTYMDYDLDGDLDIVLATAIGPVYVYENNHHKNNSIAFKLEDSIGNRNGVSSVVTIYYGNGKHQKREILLSGGYKSFDESIVYFGLGTHEKVDKIVIDWSLGAQTILEETLVSGAVYTITRK